MSVQADELGIVSGLQQRRQRFLDNNPSIRRQLEGKRPDVTNAKEHHISVDCKTGEKTIHAGVDLSRHAREIQQRSDALVRAAVERAVQERAQRLLAEEGEARRNAAPTISIREIYAAVIEGTEFSYDELVGPRRSRTVSRARHILFWLMRELRRDLSLPAIGRAVGNRDHTTIMAGVRRFQEVREQQPTKDWLQHPAIAELVDRISP